MAAKADDGQWSIVVWLFEQTCF